MYASRGSVGAQCDTYTCRYFEKSVASGSVFHPRPLGECALHRIGSQPSQMTKSSDVFLPQHNVVIWMSDKLGVSSINRRQATEVSPLHHCGSLNPPQHVLKFSRLSQLTSVSCETRRPHNDVQRRTTNKRPRHHGCMTTKAVRKLGVLDEVVPGRSGQAHRSVR
ncbi:hypothetical protein BGZ61DRAFT_449083 [Ilyonectria robusta]|uniref:uncharacterized protein n=1 Tax=Ilyonectria robusta TaxID=1079257 RepID=UPI001E8E9DC8|nr:uncharacterized protein BGZ61DRAFT_449083 [Ilyonectria robusta]KAH8714459.1 hypothetical protein BGZ61DRAFT_449083 [Ilyonectria robusta]